MTSLAEHSPASYAPRSSLSISPLQTDVYAFGVLMLRLATNLPALLGAGTPRSTSLNAHVRQALFGAAWEDRGAAAAAGRRPEDVPSEDWAALGADAADAGPCAWDDRTLAAFGALALRCTEAAPEARPLMADVVVSLEGILAARGQEEGGGDEPLSLEALLLRIPDCRICMDEPRATAFLPCRHSVACVPCAQQLMQRGLPCPICRVAVASIFHADGDATFVPPPGPATPRRLSPAFGAAAAADATPSPRAVLAWPKHARVFPTGASGAGTDAHGAPKRVSFPTRDAAGGVFATLKVSLFQHCGMFPIAKFCPLLMLFRQLLTYFILRVRPGQITDIKVLIQMGRSSIATNP